MILAVRTRNVRVGRILLKLHALCHIAVAVANRVHSKKCCEWRFDHCGMVYDKNEEDEVVDMVG